jgi:tetratricopeptide (TPR) repeat protein
MPIRYGLGLGLLLSFALSAAITHAQAAPSAAETEEQARAHFRLGRAHYDNGNFAQAAVEFEEAYRISQRAALLYNIYLAYRDANDTRNAAEALRKYLALEQNIENRGQLESRLAALDKSLQDNPSGETSPGTTAPPGTPAEPAQPLTPVPAAPEATPGPDAAVAPSEPAVRPFPVVQFVARTRPGARGHQEQRPDARSRDRHSVVRRLGRRRDGPRALSVGSRRVRKSAGRDGRARVRARRVQRQPAHDVLTIVRAPGTFTPR